MIVIIYIFILAITIFTAYWVYKSGKLSKHSTIYIIIPTLLYWYWESRAEGNIRIDLLIIYPILFAIYIAVLWGKFRYYSLFISALLMVINILFFIFSYDFFGKYPG
jgi:hypothetical protein